MRIGRKERQWLKKQNQKWPETLTLIPQDTFPARIRRPPGLIEVWRSRGFLVQVFRECEGLLRLSVCRSDHNGDRWVDGITWDDLQRLKRECGRGAMDAVEIFPADDDVVDVANIRHLFVFETEKIEFAWRRDHVGPGHG